MKKLKSESVFIETPESDEKASLIKKREYFSNLNNKLKSKFTILLRNFKSVFIGFDDFKQSHDILGQLKSDNSVYIQSRRFINIYKSVKADLNNSIFDNLTKKIIEIKNKIRQIEDKASKDLEQQSASYL